MSTRRSGREPGPRRDGADEPVRYHRVLTCACVTGAGKLALTIADLAGSDDIESVHLAEALQYRPKIMV